MTMRLATPARRINVFDSLVIDKISTDTTGRVARESVLLKPQRFSIAIPSSKRYRRMTLSECS